MEAITPLDDIDDLDIQRKVESLTGKGTRVLDCEKSSWFQQEEILLVNGFPVPLQGDEGRRIKEFMQSGKVLPPELVNLILRRAGILSSAAAGGGGVEFEATTVESRSITKTRESVLLRDSSGLVLDGTEYEVEDHVKSGSETDGGGVWNMGSVNSIKSFGRGTEMMRLGMGRQRGELGSNGSSSCWSSSESDEVFVVPSSSPSSSALLSPSGQNQTSAFPDSVSFIFSLSPRFPSGGSKHGI